jgi:hypothetical protein
VAAGVDPAYSDAWYVEPPAKRNRAATFTERDLAIRALHPGDRLVVHSAPRLGATEAEIRAAAAAVAAQDASIYDCEAGAEVRFHPDAGRLLAWAAAGAVLAAKERAGTARRAITRRGAPPKALVGAKLAEAKKLWPDAGLSIAAIAEAVGVSDRTLYRAMKQGLLPKRGDT